MNSFAPLVLFLIALVLNGCSTAPVATSPRPQEAEEMSGSAIGIEIRVLGPVGYSSTDADTVYFIRRCNHHFNCDEKPYVSHYAKDGRVYLLNPPVGDYEAVATSFTRTGVLSEPNVYITYLSTDAVRQTLVSVGKGQLIFAGSYVIGTSLGVCPGKADETQLSFAAQFEPNTPKCGYLQRNSGQPVWKDNLFVSGKADPASTAFYHYSGAIKEMDRDRTSEIDFLEKARADLENIGWRLPE